MSARDVVIETLTEKIQRQDRFIAELEGELRRAREASVDRMLGHPARWPVSSIPS